MFDNPKYKSLAEVLEMAYKRASEGKGHQHHSHGEPFDEQWIVRGAKVFGIGGPLYQSGKKLEQVMKMVVDKENHYPTEAVINELLDVINYSAATVIYLRPKKVGTEMDKKQEQVKEELEKILQSQVTPLFRIAKPKNGKYEVTSKCSGCNKEIRSFALTFLNRVKRYASASEMYEKYRCKKCRKNGVDKVF